ncbi:MAG: uroporphyrinogen-III synthase [Thioalkalivibrio sp.]|nr:MAG: uroporphyrinogen-III synthase [Thioalkalivibrio sp.]
MVQATGSGAPPAAVLAGRHVVVTRPEAQAGSFCAMLEQAGARVSRFPVIEIRAPLDPSGLQSALQGLSGYDIAVFVSANAVGRVVPVALARGPWPSGVRVAAIGASTARQLTAQGLAPDIVPGSRFDSEALLEADALQAVEGLRVVIFRGDGGREHLARTLRSRGAEVTHVEAYRRALPEIDPQPLGDALEAGTVDAITVTSGESLQNLVKMLEPVAAEALLRTPLVVGAGRVADRAQELGFRADVVTAEDPTDAAMFRAVVEYLRR